MKEFNFEQPYVGLNAIIEKNGTILMVKEAKGPYKGKWNFPGGRWDQKETLATGVSREVTEETGLDFEPNEVLGLYTKFKNRPSMTIVALQIIFLGTVTGELKILSDDVEEARFFSIQEIESLSDEKLFDLSYRGILEDFLSGRRFPLDIISHAESFEPEFNINQTD